MHQTPFSALACPLDGAPLHAAGQSWRCEHGHNFDTAREGYIHLLPVQKKRSRDPGDSKEMVAARRRFLNAGFYAPIADAVNSAVLADASGPIRCLDAGCGEGYYLRQLAAAAKVEKEDQSLEMLGLDISKPAVIAAAKQDQSTRWVVGSNACLPVISGSASHVLCLFGFPVYPEFVRVLQPGGLLLQVDAGPNHLRELREIIYPALRPPSRAESSVPAGFTQQHEQLVTYNLTLNSRQDIADLLLMTPHNFRASPESREHVRGLDSLSVTVDVKLRLCVA